MSQLRTWSARQGARARTGAHWSWSRISAAPWKRIGIWAGGAFGVLVTAFVLFLTFADWNALRGPIGRFASAATGREIVIRGDLDVNPWSWTPEISVSGLEIGNPVPYRDRGQFAVVGQARAAVRWLPLFGGRLDFTKLELSNTHIELYRSAAGVSNWAPNAQRGKPFNLPAIRRFSLTDGRVHLLDDKRHIDLDAAFTTEESADPRNPGRFALNGEGRINQRTFALELTGAPLLNVRRDRPYPFNADVRAGATHIAANGAISRPFDLSYWGADIRATGPDLADLYDLIGLALPNTPPYNLHGRLERTGMRYGMPEVSGRVGDSDITGHFTAGRQRNNRLLLEGAFTSRSLDFDDLMTVLGGAPDTTETASPEQRQMAANLEAQGRLLPDARLDISRVRNMDARVSYRAAHVRTDRFPLRGLSLDINLDNGLLRLDPLTLELSRGRVAGAVAINAREDTPRVDLDVRLTNARLESIFATQSGSPLTGALAGRAHLTGVGASVRQAAATARGDVALVIPSGEVRESLAELTGINVVRGLGLLLSHDQSKIDIRCGVASFRVDNGIAHARSIVVDTETMLIGGEGRVSLRDETLDLRLQGEPKEPRIIRVAAPITLTGRLRSPEVGIQAGPIAGQGGLAAALGSLISPVAAVLPFIDFGLADDANCQQLLAGHTARPREG